MQINNVACTGCSVVEDGLIYCENCEGGQGTNDLIVTSNSASSEPFELTYIGNLFT